MRVLVACEFSGIVRDAFIIRGHDAWSCDLLPSEAPGPHLQGDVLDYLTDDWDLLIGHPPCTYLSNSGVRHLHEHVTSKYGVRAEIHGEKRREYMLEGAAFFNKLWKAPINKIALENPVPHKYAKNEIGPYTQLLQPWHFGHDESKGTCLWLKNLPPLRPTHIKGGGFFSEVAPREIYHRVHLTPETKDRAHKRSRTFVNIAKAMATQWG